MREVPPGGCIEGVWSSGPTGLPPYVARARVARPTPGGQRGARAWPEKPKGNERKRKSDSSKIIDLVSLVGPKANRQEGPRGDTHRIFANR